MRLQRQERNTPAFALFPLPLGHLGSPFTVFLTLSCRVCLCPFSLNFSCTPLSSSFSRLYTLSEARRTQPYSYTYFASPPPHVRLWMCVMLWGLKKVVSEGMLVTHLRWEFGRVERREIWVLEMEGYSKNGCGRKDKYSSWNGGWVGGKEVDVEREGLESESESTRKGNGEPGQTQSSNAAQAPLSLPFHHPCCCTLLWGLTGPQPQTSLVLVYHCKAGHLDNLFYFHHTLIWDI